MQPKEAASHKVLVVEDEGLIAHDISSRLTALGHEVIAVASTAEEALEKAGEADIVLMDIRIDGAKDGITAATEIRERYHVPVVFLTAHADRATLERAKAAEPFGYIVKPLAHSTLNTSIEIALYKHRTERELAEREAWLRTILGSIGDAVIVTDVESRVVMLNRAAESLTGWIHPEAKGWPIWKIAQFVEKEQAGTDPIALAILRDAPMALDRSWKMIARDGRELWIDGIAAPVKAGDGAGRLTTIGAALSFRDVSAKRWEERQLRQMQRLEAAGRLAAGISTDFSNLLAIVRNQAGQLLRQFGEYSPARKAAEEIEQAASAAEQINKRLVAFGTRQVSHQQVLSLNAVVRKSAKLIESVTDPGVELAIRTSPVTFRVKADEGQIEQALMTLVIHACATMNGAGRLLIETGNIEVPSNGHMAAHSMLALSYTGQEEDPESLFDPSATGDDSLALSIVHGIVAESGGFLSAQATAGGGSRLEMLLPRHEGAALLPQRASGEAPSILLVEDRANVREQLHNFFEANGYNLLETADRAEAAAVAQMHDGSLDLVIAEAGLAEAFQPHCKILKIVNRKAAGENEIQRPFTQQGLLEKVEALIRPWQPAIESSAAAESSV